MFAAPTPDLCDGVPRNAASKAAYDWTEAQCKRVRSPSAYCFAVVGVLIELPVMLMLVKICLRTQGRFRRQEP